MGLACQKASELPDSLKPLARRQAIEIRHTNFNSDAETLFKRLREVLGYDPLGPRRRVLAIKAVAAMAVLFLVAWGGYTFVHPTRVYLEESFRAVQQLVEEARAERERQARVAAEAEEKRKADEAEQQRLAAFKFEQELQARAAAEAEIKRLREQAEQQGLAAVKAEQDRQAEAKRKADEAEQQRLVALKAEEDRKAKAAAEAAFTIRRGMEASGPDTMNVREIYHMSSFEACHLACAQLAQPPKTCNVFTYFKITGACRLYNRADLSPNAGFDSGVRNWIIANLNEG
jgi:flagellar biosynthesis GTPase FlhF